MFLFSCQTDIETINKITEVRKRPSFEVHDFETIVSDSGRIQVKITSPKLSRFDKNEIKYDEYIKGIAVEFYDKSMILEATLTCDYAKYLIDKEIWEAKFNVEVNNVKENEKLNTELLYWNMNKEKIYSDKFVKITRSEEILFGEGFESNQDFSKWKILKITGTKSIKDE